MGDIQTTRQFLSRLPREMTVGEVLDMLAVGRQTATCKHCSKPIETNGGDRWFHVSDGSRGCRAASFNREGRAGESAWDETLDRRWTATPAASRA
jgi:hypothetical protein